MAETRSRCALMEKSEERRSNLATVLTEKHPVSLRMIGWDWDIRDHVVQMTYFSSSSMLLIRYFIRNKPATSPSNIARMPVPLISHQLIFKVFSASPTSFAQLGDSYTLFLSIDFFVQYCAATFMLKAPPSTIFINSGFLTFVLNSSDFALLCNPSTSIDKGFGWVWQV